MENSELMLDVGQANELKMAFRRAGYTNAEIKKLCSGDFLSKTRKVLHNKADFIDVINCDVFPFCPDDLKIFDHKKGGKLRWDPEKISLYQSDRQKNDLVIGNNDLQEEIENIPVLNANVLDYILHLGFGFRLKEWRGKMIIFRGTTYCDLDGHLYHRMLYCENNYGYSWTSGIWAVEHGYNKMFFSAILVPALWETE